MKKLAIVLAILFVCCAFVGCGSSNGEATPDSNAATEPAEITREDIEDRVPYALYQRLNVLWEYQNYTDLEQTRYNLGSVKKEQGYGNEWYWWAYGTYTVYDKYGSPYENGEFRLKFTEDGVYDEDGSDISTTYEF